jgi:hypothetical protein
VTATPWTRLGKRRFPARASVLLAVAVAAVIQMAAPASALASAVCPPPGTLADIIAVDATTPSPLTEQFRPVYGVYAEGAAACWPGQELVLTGFVSSPEGLGGTSPFTIEPVWLVSRAHFLSTSAVVDAESGPVGPFFPVAVPLRLERAFTRQTGNWVRVSGHFDDQLASTCVVSEGTPDVSPTPEQAVQICRTSFVLTSVAPLATPNTDTDTAASEASASSRRGSLAELIAALTAAAFVLSLRRSSKRMAT